MNAVLDYLEGFWMGLERKSAGFAQVWTQAGAAARRVNCASKFIDPLTGRRIIWSALGSAAMMRVFLLTSAYPEWTVPDLLRRSASRFPESPALFFYGARISLP